MNNTSNGGWKTNFCTKQRMVCHWPHINVVNTAMISEKKRIQALNSFLTVIYQSEGIRLSNVLLNIGFNNDEVMLLRNHAEELAIGCASLLKQKIFLHDNRAFIIINRRFGLGGKPPQTLREVGIFLGITRERVRQLEEKALDKCRKELFLKIWEMGIKRLSRSYLASYEARKKADAYEDNDPSSTEEGRQPEESPFFTFEIKTDLNKGKFLHIKGCSSSQVEESITLTEEKFIYFHKSLMKAARKIGWDDLIKSKKIPNAKGQYYRAYEKWTFEEEEVLIEMFSKGAGIDELSALLERQPGAIRSRLQKKGLIP